VKKFSFVPGVFRPVKQEGSTKYGNTGICDETMFGNMDIPQEVKLALAGISNHGLAKETWSSCRTGERMLLKCQKECGRKLNLPLGKADLLIFIDWLIRIRGLKAATVNCYLAAIRQLHITKGLEPPVLRDSQVKLILRGQQNIDNAEKRKNKDKGRLPVTMTMMKLLKEKIRQWDKDNGTKLLVWAVCTVAFHGAFRIHELLCRTETSFDPAYDLLRQDVKIEKATYGGETTRFLTIRLKCPKEQRDGKTVVVDVFESGGDICPVRAYSKWAKGAQGEAGWPVFRAPCGTPLTGRKLNSYIKTLLGECVDYRKGRITSHSFRSGIASILGSKGFSDEEIKQAGRWSSNAFQAYMKLPRTRRAAIARKIGQL
jgi:hypothetical protein